MKTINRAVCAVCKRTEETQESPFGTLPDGWLMLQCSKDYRNYWTREICPQCWKLLFVELFDRVTEPPPALPKGPEVSPSKVAPCRKKKK